MQLYGPEHFWEFACVASTCQSNCCRSWRIFIEKDIYEKYNSLDDNRIRSCLCQIEVQKENGSGEQYAKIKHGKGGWCPFLEENHLCYIHRTYGEEFLSSTCRQYPRFFRSICGQKEAFIYNSCPEAVKALPVNRKIQFLQISQTDEENSLPEHLTEDLEAIKIEREYIQMLQQRGEPELKLLSMFMKTEQISGWGDCLLKYRRVEGVGKIQLEAFEYMSKHILSNLNYMGEGFLKYMIMALNGLKESHKERPLRVEAPELNQYGLLIENFLAVEFYNDFYNRKSITLTPIIQRMIVRTELLYCVLSGVALYRGALDMETVYEILYSFSRITMHNFGFVPIANEIIKNYKLDELERIIAFLGLVEDKEGEFCGNYL